MIKGPSPNRFCDIKQHLSVKGGGGGVAQSLLGKGNTPQILHYSLCQEPINKR